MTRVEVGTVRYIDGRPPAARLQLGGVASVSAVSGFVVATLLHLSIVSSLLAIDTDAAV